MYLHNVSLTEKVSSFTFLTLKKKQMQIKI